MHLEKQEFYNLIKNFEFKKLFNQLGWDHSKVKPFPISVKDKIYDLTAIVDKRDFLIFICDSNIDNKIPSKEERRKIDRELTKLFQEHLIIYIDKNRSQQLWQLSIKEPNKPVQYKEFQYFSTQQPELLFQKLRNLLFTLDEEEKISILDVKLRVSEQFSLNAEKVTKKFYDKFKKEHSAFRKFIDGIEDQLELDWYTSLMLNRLMFIYFIQKKGFLDSNTNYLREKLTLSMKKKGKDKFYKSFYKNFLLVLFHEGFNKPKHSKDLQNEIGKIPYLNGGLFDVHQIEQENKNINIKDEAFKKLFDFFDEYTWHLDIRENASGNEINPDVIGYIFEKYINDRAAMGAYYTKEDITEYISKNTIILFLFDRVLEKVKNAFTGENSVWNLLKENPDRYIYDAVKHGIYHQDSVIASEAKQSPSTVIASEERAKQSQNTVISTEGRNLNIRPLPKEIQQGINPEIQNRIVKDVENNPPQLLELRKEWNKPAPPEFGLPTEIWREVVERRQRFFEIRQKIENGEINKIEDFVTYNLNIRQFVQDVIEQYEGSDLIEAFYDAITQITILDPTCGSGAFLFAALNILEPLYEACLERMRAFVEYDNEKGTGKKFTKFRKVLDDIELHPNEKYFIYKSIILRNLYGVDIMNEAVEIAKLRLFLKLVAEVEPDPNEDNFGLEPLPDIDFNIRAGNTLVGYATEKELNDGLSWSFDFGGDKEKIQEKIETVALAYKRYKENQLEGNEDSFASFKNAKDELRKRLIELNNELNDLLAKDYGITNKKKEKKKYEDWLKSHKPFHWFAEFYEIINGNGGFDVVIGNPPYLEVRQINYQPNSLRTFDSGAVHNMCIERSLQILSSIGNISMIVPLALVCTQRMTIVQNLLENNKIVWYSNFAWRPGKLFENVNRALTIFVSNYSKVSCVYNTNYIKWSSDTRDDVFPNISFTPWNEKRTSFWVPKLGSKIEEKILKKVLKTDKTISHLLTNHSTNRVYYRTTGGLYWKIFTNFSPKFYINGKKGKSSRETFFTVNEKNKDIICIAILSSDLFWWWYTVTSNLRDLNPSDIQGFKFPSSVLEDSSLLNTGKEYLNDLELNSTMLTRIQKQTGKTKTQSFKIALSKPIIDEIDKILAEHYGFTEEELDFIINYDIKYRMGKELNGEDDE
ncbi:MAG: Eco57I restriction-modification methylase domain-containing protein [Melioribacteraceae bacterium]|nr:Eco57I restriction-modification methylase domain-containing protein [Melioribacteraceae bacterium]